MKRIIFACFVCVFSIPFAFSQNVEAQFNSNHSIKRIENNMWGGPGFYNIESKSDIEKVFFGNFNALIEFCYEPSFDHPSGFRIIRDSLNSSYILEVKHISNYREASKEAEKEAEKMHMPQLLDLPVRLLDSLPRDVLNQIREYIRSISDNNVYRKMYFEVLSKHFKVEIKSIHISNQFADKLYKMMGSFIGNFKAKGVPPTTVDGYSVSFRTVVDDEVWSLGITMPRGNAEIMTNLCMKIIKDANDDQLDESMNLSVLNK